MAYCTHCGHQNDAAASFCQECGTPQTRTGEAQAVPAQPTSQVLGEPMAPTGVTVERGAPRWPYVAGGLTLVVGIGAGAAFLMAPEAPSNERFATIMDKHLQTVQDIYRYHYCFQDEDLGKPRLTLGVFDPKVRTLEILVEADLYRQSAVLNEGTLFKEFEYTKTDFGQRATIEGKLCFARGLAVERVQDFSPPRELDNATVSTAKVTYKLVDPLPFVTAARSKAVIAALRAPMSEVANFALVEGHWQWVTPAFMQEALSKSANASEKSNSKAGIGSWFGSVKAMIGGNPLIGRWRGEAHGGFLGTVTSTMDFGADTLRVNGSQPVPAHYTINGQEVTVKEGSMGNEIVIHMEDHDHAWYTAQGVRVELSRSN